MKRAHRGFLYRASLSFLILGTAASLGAGAYDIIYQAATDGRRVYTLLIISGAYFVFGLLIAFFAGTRWIATNRARSAIPRSVLPIRKESLPKLVYALVHREFSQVDKLRASIQPLPEDSARVGWGRPDGELAGIQFRAAACETFDLLAEEALLRFPILQRTPGMTAHQFFDQLVAHATIDRRMARIYVSAYESARFGDEEWSEAKYLDFMKLVSVILHRQVPLSAAIARCCFRADIPCMAVKQYRIHAQLPLPLS